MLLLRKKFILWFDQLTIKDIPKVGGKNASLGEMYQKLVSQGINIPNGFAVTAQAYFYLLKKSGIRKKIRKILQDLDTKNIKSLISKGEQIRELILGAELPKDLKQQ